MKEEMFDINPTLKIKVKTDIYTQGIIPKKVEDLKDWEEYNNGLLEKIASLELRLDNISGQIDFVPFITIPLIKSNWVEVDESWVYTITNEEHKRGETSNFAYSLYERLNEGNHSRSDSVSIKDDGTIRIKSGFAWDGYIVLGNNFVAEVEEPVPDEPTPEPELPIEPPVQEEVEEEPVEAILWK